MKRPPTRAFVLGGLLVVAAAGVVHLGRMPVPTDPTAPASRPAPPIDAIPRDAMLLVTADLARLRAFGLAPEVIASGRAIPGLGDVRSACGFDPIAAFSAVALAVPEGGADGDFGLVARGDEVPADSLLACTSKVIEARGGRPVISTIGTFRTVRDVALAAPGGEIAARPGGLVLLGAGSYLRAMIDAADGQVTSVRGHEGHQRLRAALGDDGVVVATLVLGPRQRAAMAEEVTRAGAEVAPPAVAKVGAAGVALGLEGADVALHAVLACDDGRAAIEVAAAIERIRQGQAADPWVRLAGIGPLLDAVLVEVERERVHVRAKLPRAEAERLITRFLAGRGDDRPSAPLEAASAAPSAPPAASAEPAPSAEAAPSALPSPPAPSASARKKGKPPTDIEF